MEENQTPTSPIAGEPALMALRATMHSALAHYANVVDGWAAAADDLADAVEQALAQVDAVLGITEPADKDPYAGKNPEWVKVEKACLPTIPRLDKIKGWE